MFSLSRLILSLMIVAIAVAVPAVQGSARAPEPYQLVRVLMNMQRSAVQGDQTAQANRRKFIGQIGKVLSKTGTESWKRQENVDALIVYLLSGGSASIVQRLRLARNMSRDRRRMLLGSVAFLKGEKSAAKKLLGSVDILRVPPLVAGPLGLAIAAVLAPENLPRAHRVLEQVELLAPGTLYEETALRRHILSMSKGAPIATFVNLVQRYERRFPKSPYADNFREHVRVLAKSKLLGAKSYDDRLIATLEGIFPVEMRFSQLLKIAMEAGASGKSDVALWLSSYICRQGHATARSRIIAAQLLQLSAQTADGKRPLKSCHGAAKIMSKPAWGVVLSQLNTSLKAFIEAAPTSGSAIAAVPEKSKNVALEPGIASVLKRAERGLKAASELIGGASPGS